MAFELVNGGSTGPAAVTYRDRSIGRRPRKTMRGAFHTCTRTRDWTRLDCGAAFRSSAGEDANSAAARATSRKWLAVAAGRADRRVDGDAAMLDKRAGDRRVAKSAGSNPILERAADVAPDLLYSNAALHWLDGHEMLFPRLMQGVARAGALAVQMPDNFRAPSHRLLYEVARSSRWRDVVGALVRPDPVHASERYFDWLEPHARAIDAWSTEYLQLLPARSDGEHPVVAWMKGSALVPMIAALDARRAARSSTTKPTHR